MQSLHQIPPLASGLCPHASSTQSDTTIRVAMAAGMGTSLAVLYSLQLHGLSTHILTHAGLQQPSQLATNTSSLPVFPESHDSKMGNLFSKEKCRSGRGRTPPSEKFTPSKYPYQPMQPPPISRPNQLPPQPGPIHGAYHHPQCRIDPRDDLYYQRPQFSAPVVTNRYPPTASNRPPTSTSFSSSTTLRPSNDSVNPPPRGKPPAPPSSSSIEATRPPKASKAAKGRFARFKPKDSECYAIQLHCTECARQGNSCPITPDLNLPPYTGDSQRDRRSQWWQVPSQRWEVHMDLCSREAIANNRGEDKKKALLGLNRAMGAYGTDEERGKAKRLFCKSELDELEQQLRRGGVKFESYYFKSGETQPTYLP